MIRDKSAFINEILEKTQSNEIQFKKHPKLNNAFIWEYVLNDGTEISITVDRYEANFRSQMSQCVNLYISSLKNTDNIVRCLNSSGSFLEEYNLIDRIYTLCQERVQTTSEKLKSLELQLAN